MGGSGSGRWSGFGKTTVEHCLSLDINKLVRDRLLYAGIHTSVILTWTNTRTGKEASSCGFEVNTLDPSFSWVRLFYTLTRTGEKIGYKTKLETTRPYFGGLRWWFTCPIVNCYRRVAKLHLPPGGKYYACRHCYDLTYTSCQESHQFDALFAKMAMDLGTTPGMVKRALMEKT
jgi:hypothetical protein